ncbi:unnamed protein product, partial [Ectocarpus sp. 4 AP-2014]
CAVSHRLVFTFGTNTKNTNIKTVSQPQCAKKLMFHPPITLCPRLAQLQEESNGSLCLHRWAKKSSAPFSDARLASSNHSKKNTTGREPMARHPHDNSPDNVRPTHKVQRTPQV